ncbi:MAG: glycosyltransferase [Loktanella sp.]|nr:glycosyltransferase [Loktanella sp.]
MGGIETHCAELLPRMAKKSEDLKLTVLARRRYATVADPVPGVKQIALYAPSGRGTEALVHSHWSVLYARLFLKADAVHIHGIGPGLSVPLARLLGMGVLFTHHGEDFARAKWNWLARFVLRVGEFLALRFAQCIITVSAGTATRLKKRAPARANRIIHVPNGVSAPATGGAAEVVMERHHLEPGRFVIHVGRIEPEKGQDMLIEAYRAAGLALAKSPVKLLLVGAADHESAYSRKIATMKGDGVELAGRLDRDTVFALNAQAALFVLPSLHEGLSIAALEALKADAPVLLSDIEPNRNIGLEDRHYLAPDSVEAWAEGLRGDLSRHAVREGFDASAYDWDVIADRTLEALDEVTQNSGCISKNPRAAGDA